MFSRDEAISPVAMATGNHGDRPKETKKRKKRQSSEGSQSQPQEKKHEVPAVLDLSEVHTPFNCCMFA